jgi:hypothetical protein
MAPSFRPCASPILPLLSFLFYLLATIHTSAASSLLSAMPFSQETSPTSSATQPDPDSELDLMPEPSQDSSLPTYWGSLLSLEKPLDCMRLLLQNPHGLDAKNDYRKIDLTAKYIAAYQFDIACLPETNADWKSLALAQPATHCSASTSATTA